MTLLPAGIPGQLRYAVRSWHSATLAVLDLCVNLARCAGMLRSLASDLGSKRMPKE